MDQLTNEANRNITNLVVSLFIEKLESKTSKTLFTMSPTKTEENKR